MDTSIRFDPARRRGSILHVTVLLLLTLVVGGMLTLAILLPPGFLPVLLLVGALIMSLSLPLLFYRLYSLLQSGYWVARAGLRLRWGLRQVDLPHAAILDVARAEELENPIMLPRLAWPGALLGQVQDKELGLVEFLGSELKDLVLLGTKERVYAISPQNPEEFVITYKRESERGSLRSLRARSISPSFVLFEAWSVRSLRRLLVTGAILSLVMLFLVSLLAPGLDTISLGFAADGSALKPVAGVQLFLLPALNLFFYMGNFMLGLLFYRETKGVNFSYLLWGCSLFTSLLFFGAVLFSL